MTVTESSENVQTAQDHKIDELRTEASVVMRTSEHIANDLDQFSDRIRRLPIGKGGIVEIERHLGRARRNCAEAMSIAEAVLEELTSVSTASETTSQADRLKEAYACLALADSAYLRAFDRAGA